MEKIETTKNIRIHRVGTITLGGGMIGIGSLFLLQMFWQELSFGFIYRIWPVMLIMLGIEVLLANASQKREFVYDKLAMFLVAVLIIFTMSMAVIGDINAFYYSGGGY